jgi:hypothetical protein
MDALVQRFPTDYRSYFFRGLYFSSFAPLNEESFKPAIENLSKAAELNAKSALPQLFKAEILGLVFYKRLIQLGRGDAERDKLNYELLREYEKALSLDQNLLPALSGRALAHFDLKHFQNPSLITTKFSHSTGKTGRLTMIEGWLRCRSAETTMQF